MTMKNASVAMDPVSTLSPNLKTYLREFAPTLYLDMSRWMKKHGKLVRPKLTDKQYEELQQVFKLMDDDGSGAIDIDELGAAFKLLGFQLTKNEILQLMDQVDEDGSGELDFSGFLEIMTTTVHEMTEKKKNSDQVPFALMATAYRRKKILGDVLENTQASLGGVVQTGIDDAQRQRDRDATRLQERAEAEARAALGVLANTHPASDLMRVSELSKLDPLLLAQMFGKEELHAVAQLLSLRQGSGLGSSWRPCGRAPRKSYSQPLLPTLGSHQEQPDIVDDQTSPKLQKLIERPHAPPRRGKSHLMHRTDNQSAPQSLSGHRNTTHASDSALLDELLGLSPPPQDTGLSLYSITSKKITSVLNPEVCAASVARSRSHSFPPVTEKMYTGPRLQGAEVHRIRLPLVTKPCVDSEDSVSITTAQQNTAVLTGKFLRSLENVQMGLRRPLANNDVMLPVKGKRLPPTVQSSLPTLPGYQVKSHDMQRSAAGL
ncbi:hypothetical protein CEUSTIGMA_g7437.t1 [Chlamydomonas eustigma]|uniref:EF-hand domain-containing protein n=1 Tax=Chlamydomonas eustigma TaxID=1157962 RepID=A0A250XA99_9CHLO|nr:hypothetical protein CEUSTIGMA_g7437.t1 [Chlamydomonas eustigma]|eukprot:GAX79997.1 hypothetical protein CEUSTIGMA_g7437.t1 [Chlamydomonas eustigma]